MTQSDITAFNMGVTAVLDLARLTAAAHMISEMGSTWATRLGV